MLNWAPFIQAISSKNDEEDVQKMYPRDKIEIKAYQDF